jgi:hypothetical protein
LPTLTTVMKHSPKTNSSNQPISQVLGETAELLADLGVRHANAY